MNTSQLAALRWMMERELSALRSPRMSPEISLKCPDENELASRLSERAVDERLTARRVERIRDLENALRRIEVMDYGVCAQTGKPLIRAGSMAFFEEVWAKSVDCGFTRGRGICPSSVGKEGRASSGDYPVCIEGVGWPDTRGAPKRIIADRAGCDFAVFLLL